MKARLVNSGPLVGANGHRVAAELAHRVEQPRHILAAHAVIDGNVHALAAEVVDDRQALDAPAVGQRVHHEVGTPGVVDVAAGRQRRALEADALGLAALAQRQLVHLVQPPHTLVVHLVALPGEQVVDASVAEAPALMRQLDDAGTELAGSPIGHRRLPIACSGQPRIDAGAAFADVEQLDHPACRLSPGLRG
jgi:hypothetical protein